MLFLSDSGAGEEKHDILFELWQVVMGSLLGMIDGHCTSVFLTAIGCRSACHCGWDETCPSAALEPHVDLILDLLLFL